MRVLEIYMWLQDLFATSPSSAPPRQNHEQLTPNLKYKRLS